LVHSSLRSLGWVCGAATAVVQALSDAVGPAGTIVVPAQTAGNREPATWLDPPPRQWWPQIRDHLPAFDAAISPSQGMGLIAELVRTWPGSSRSNHPQNSFAAVGALAAEVTAVHRLESKLGEHSPVAALEAADAKILLLGVGYEACTAIHLAEYRVPDPPRRTLHCAVMDAEGQRTWTAYDTVDLDHSDFRALGADFEGRTGLVTIGRVGEAEARLFPVRGVVEFALKWFIDNR